MPTRKKRKRSQRRATAAPREAKRTLAIDIGGTGIKMLPLDAKGRPLAERHRELTPKPANPRPVLSVIKKMIGAQKPFDRVSVGFPGVVVRGTVKTAPNLGTEAWRGFDLAKAIASHTGRPTRVVNDADLQGYGVIRGQGVELVLTLGTGLGAALFVDGRLMPNLELGHHPFKKGKTYEELISNAELQRAGKKRWRKRMTAIFDQLDPIFNYDVLHLGGGNARKLKAPLPKKVRVFTNVDGLAGGIRLWKEA